MKTLVLTVCSMLVFVVVAEQHVAQRKRVKNVDVAHMKEVIYKCTGGKIREPGIQRGKIFYVNCQKEADLSLINENASYFSKEVKIDVEVCDGSFDFKNPNVIGQASLFIVDDPTLPMSLFAPEGKWGMVNVSPLKCDKRQFFEARLKKELTRGFCFLAGAVASQYPHSLVEGVTRPEDLDRYADAELPFDVLQRFPTYLAGYGIRPYRLITYKAACEMGIAPEPTNDVQRAIWNRAKDEKERGPANALKIVPPTKK